MTNNLITLGLNEAASKSKMTKQLKSIAKQISDSDTFKIKASLDQARSQAEIQQQLNNISKNLKVSVGVDIDTSAIKQQQQAINQQMKSGINATKVKVPFQFDLSDSNAVKAEINKIVADITNNKGQLVKYKINVDDNGQATKALLTYRNELNEVTNATLKLQSVGKWYDANGMEHNIVKWSEGQKTLSQNIEATVKANQKQIESDNQVTRKKQELIAQMKLLNTQAEKAGVSLSLDNQDKFNDLSINTSTLEDIKQLESYLRLARTEYQTLNAEISKGTHATALETMNKNLATMPNDIDLIEAKFNSIKIPDGVSERIEQLRTDMQSISTISDPQEKINKYNELIATLGSLQKEYQVASQEQRNFNASVGVTQGASKLTNDIIVWMAQNRSAAYQFDEELKQIITDLQACNNKADFTNLQKQFNTIKAQAKAVSNMSTGFLGNLKTQLKDAFINMMRYQLAYEIIQRATNAFKSMADEVMTLNKNLTEFNKVADLSAEKLSEFSDKAYDAANEVGRIGTDMIEAATEFKRAGYSLEDSLDMGRSALLMTNVADGISQTSDAASTLIAVLKGFNIDQSDIITIVDKMNSVSNQSPVGFDNLADGLERVSGTMNQAGNSIDETIGLLTGGYAQLRNMEKVSTGLVTISQRLRAVDEDGETIDGLSAQLESSFAKIGVAIEDSNGDLRSTYDILADYAKVYPTLTSEQKQFYAELSAGKRQVNVFNAIVQQMSDVQNAIEQSKDSVGSAANENEIYRQSIEGLKNEYKNQLQLMSKAVIEQDWIKNFISAGTNLLEIITNIVEQDDIISDAIGVTAEGLKDITSAIKDITGNDGVSALIKAFITYKTITKGIDLFSFIKGKKEAFSSTHKAMTAFFQSAVSGSAEATSGLGQVGGAVDTLSGSIVAMETAEAGTTVATTGLSTAIKGLGTSLTNLAKAHPYLLAITAALGTMYALYKGIEAAQNWADGTTAVNKYNKYIEKSEQTISDNESSISDYNSQLDENKQKLAELEELQASSDITDAQKTEIENLKYENALLDDKIKKLQEANEEEKKSQANDSKKSFNKQFGDGYDVGSNANDVIKAVSKNYNGDGTANGVSWNLTTSGNENDTTVAQLAKIKLATDAYNQAVSDFNNGLNNVTQDDVDNYATTLDLLTKDFEKNKENLYNQLKSDMEKMKAVEGTDAYDATAYANMQSWLEIFQQYIPEYKKAMEKVQEEADKNPIEQGVEVKAFDDPTSLLTESDDKGTSTATLADLQSEADLLSTIQKEISENGKISVSSMQSIIKQYPEAKQALSEYLLGIISEEELFAELEGVYEDDKDAYIKSVVEKAKTDEQFFNTLKTNYPELINQLGAVYGTDVANWTSMEQAKVNITAQAIQQIADIYKEFYKAMGVENGIDFNVQATKNAISAGNPGAIGGSLFSKSYSKSNFEKVITDGNHKFKMNGNDVSNAYKELQNNIDSVWNTAEKMKNAIDDAAYNQINANIDTSWQGLGGSDSSSSSQTAEKLNWIERLVNKISTAYSRLKNIVSDTTTTWLKRNNVLSDSISTLSSEINAQKQAYEYYMNAFNGYDLDDYYKNQIANGSISIDVIYDEDLKNAISDCQDFYDKAQDAKTAVQELGIELKGLAVTKFNNISSQFGKIIDKADSFSDQLTKVTEIVEAKGMFASTNINESLKAIDQSNIETLTKERDALTNALNSAVSNGSIQAYSEEWYNMQINIDKVTSSILDAEKAIIEYNKAIRQVKWDAFDRTQDDISNLITETEFLVDVLKNNGITDESGNMNDNGMAAEALLAQKYQLYLSQAQKYKEEILKIDEKLANNPYDKELLDRKQELVKAQQDAIENSMSEKDAIISLRKDGYDKLLDTLQKIIDKFKSTLDASKDLYTYQKNIKSQTDNISSLQKQLLAIQGDDSEEAKSKTQKLKTSLESAQEDLKQTEYEKWVSDIQQILSDVYSEAENFLSAGLDNTDGLIQDVISTSNQNASDISQTINDTANSMGYNLSQSMSDIWNTSSSNIINGVGSVLGEYGTKMSDGISNINTVVNGISTAVQEMLRLSNEEAQRVADEIKRQQEAQQAGSSSSNNDWSGSDYNDWTDNWDSGSSDNGGESSSDGVDWIYEENYYPRDLLNIDQSVVDRLKWNNFASSFAARSQYYDQMGGEGQYYGTYDQNIFMLDYLKSHGLKKGTKSATAGIHRTDEEGLGSEVIFSKKYGTLRKLDAGDMVFNSDQVEKLWNLSKGITTPNMYMDNLGAKLPDIPNISNNLANKVDVEFGDVTLSLPNVHNYEDFMKQMVSDKRFLKAVQEGTFGQVLGRNSLNMLTFR